MNINSIKSRSSLKMLFGILIFASFVVNGIVITLYSVSMSGRSSSIQEEIKSLSEDNRSTLSNLYSKTSLTKIEERSEELGFSSSGDVFYIETEKPVAGLR